MSRTGQNTTNGYKRSWSMDKECSEASLITQGRTNHTAAAAAVAACAKGSPELTGAPASATYQNQRRIDDLRFIGSWTSGNSSHPAATVATPDRTVGGNAQFFGFRAQAATPNTQDPLRRWMTEDVKTGPWNSEAADASHKHRQD
ncbi:hypothetical protein K490DRAFT_64371 [Saccharata proteae CBS 121410]|uniref:Uncharacterized protein n=1 Tax=Saccharata proteae CBS 121410 TaxID=1314787 RepID=A0A6A5YEF5_9PEZI|nr:hypothetical protein K490DRAFT_64371 [Saccharata proteae CBS 121410]